MLGACSIPQAGHSSTSHDCPPLSQGQSGCFQSFTIISAGQRMAPFLQRDSLLGPKALPPVEVRGGEATVRDCQSPRPQSRRAPPSGNGGTKEDLRKPRASVTHLQSSVTHPSICLCIHLSTHPSICLSIQPPIHLSVYPSTHHTRSSIIQTPVRPTPVHAQVPQAGK